MNPKNASKTHKLRIGNQTRNETGNISWSDLVSDRQQKSKKSLKGNINRNELLATALEGVDREHGMIYEILNKIQYSKSHTSHTDAKITEFIKAQFEQ